MLRAGRCAAQGAFREHAGKVALVVDRAAAVGDGEQSSEPIAAACSNSSSEGAWPRSSSSARVTWTVVGPTALRAMPASAMTFPSIQTAADAAAIAQSPARRSTFS